MAEDAPVYAWALVERMAPPELAFKNAGSKVTISEMTFTSAVIFVQFSSSA